MTNTDDKHTLNVEEAESLLNVHKKALALKKQKTFGKEPDTKQMQEAAAVAGLALATGPNGMLVANPATNAAGDVIDEYVETPLY